ncbi:unnamed protein product, partial [Closterium sp. NIES-65]
MFPPPHVPSSRRSPLPTLPPPNVPPTLHSPSGHSPHPPPPPPPCAVSDEKDAQIGGAGGGDGAGSGGDAGDGAASGLADFIGGYAGDAGNGLSNAGESGSGGSGTGDSGDSGSGNGESGRASNGKFKGVFELPDPPSRFNARAAWHHMRYRTPDACWSQQERHLYHTADQSHPSQAFVDAVVAFEAMQRECVSQGRVEGWQWVRVTIFCLSYASLVAFPSSPVHTPHTSSPVHTPHTFLTPPTLPTLPTIPIIPILPPSQLPSSSALQPPLTTILSPLCTATLSSYSSFQFFHLSRPGVHMARAGQATLDQGVPRYGPDRKPCRYIMIHDLSRGVGNRIVSYVTSFVLGLLTNRVIIAPPNGFLTRRFCNPFARANTSWTVQPAVYDVLLAAAVPNPRLHLSDMAERLKKASMWKRVPAATRHLEGEVAQNGSVWIDLHYRVLNQFCDVVWTTADLAPFWFTSFDTYCLPSLYYIKSYADRLHELFPDRRVFTHVARFLMHPDNRLWAKITHTFLANLGHYPHRLGVQIRSPDGIDLPVANRILRCAVRAQYLPSTQPYPEDPSMATPAQRYPGGGAGDGGGDVETYRSFRTMGVFVSSLNIRHMLDLETHYAQHLTIGNTFVSFWSLTNEGRETRQEQQLIDAVMDMWILSFSDRLLITHISSFGRTAVGLAGTEAYSMAITVIKMRGIDWRNSTGPVCERVSSEPCDTLGAPVKY